jgi:hypothetical protein
VTAFARGPRVDIQRLRQDMDAAIDQNPAPRG